MFLLTYVHVWCVIKLITAPNAMKQLLTIIDIEAFRWLFFILINRNILWSSLKQTFSRLVRGCYSCHCFCFVDLILYVPSTIFHLNRDGSSWVEPVLTAQGPQCSDAGEARTRGPSVSSQVLHHCAPSCHCAAWNCADIKFGRSSSLSLISCWYFIYSGP